MSVSPYDLVVIGSGPGGYVAAIRAAQLGLRTAVVEKDAKVPGVGLGGTCLHRGCIPTKAMLKSATLLDEARHAESFGVRTSGVELDFPAVAKFRDKVVLKGARGVEYLMKKHRIDIHAGFGRLDGPGRVVVSGDGGETRLETRNVLIATGSVPRDLPFLKADGASVVNSDHVLKSMSVPASMLVIGSGAVGAEFASCYARYGTKTVLVEVLPRLLPVEDEEISREIEKSFRKKGISCHVKTAVEAVTRNGDGTVTVAATGPDGSSLSWTVEKVLLAVGRRPVTEGLGLETLGVATEKGYVVVDAHQRTNVRGVWAIGDVTPTIWLAHVASAEGIVAAESIAGVPTRPINRDQVPGCTYTDPEVASIGLPEAKARERGYEVAVGKFGFQVLAKSSMEHTNEGFVKIVSEKKYDEVLGVHIIGPHATELIGQAAAFLRCEATTEEMIRTIHAHPTLSEALHEAAEAVHGQNIHG
ncbi:MAG TPA: dihydrolipoyl dehydrogenase [Thermoanaerobaculia bacterium]|nr:dihydrolipoyl dehydrogenase [Thermoanaerobaculia bacterium]HQR67211.1 dihydrolipoyl dehydrogenase [Thermoanaerobaculia bacterium]